MGALLALAVGVALYSWLSPQEPTRYFVGRILFYDKDGGALIGNSPAFLKWVVPGDGRVIQTYYRARNRNDRHFTGTELVFRPDGEGYDIVMAESGKSIGRLTAKGEGSYWPEWKTTVRLEDGTVREALGRLADGRIHIERSLPKDAPQQVRFEKEDYEEVDRKTFERTLESVRL